MRHCTRWRPLTKPKLEGWGFAEGDPIIYLVNDYQKEFGTARWAESRAS